MKSIKMAKNKGNPQRKGQWLINKIRSENENERLTSTQTENRIWNISNEKFDRIMDKYDDEDISPCPKCGCETVVSKDDKWVCESCGEVILG